MLLPAEQILDTLRRSEAVCLFEQRARAALPAFGLTQANGEAVAEVCRRLDGIPLAIGMAAARVSVLPVQEIAARLDDGFRALMMGSRTALPRHQTVAAAIEWSHELLGAREQVLLRRLSVFAGGWTLEAAEAVCAGEESDTGHSIGRGDVLALLARLVDVSLVMVQDAGTGKARYRLLRTVRQYAQEKLAECGEAHAVRRRHLEWFLAFAETAVPELWGPAQQEWLSRLDAEHDNLRAALETSQSDPACADLGLRLAGELRRFWYMHGHATEGRRWMERVLARSADAPVLARAKALHGLLQFQTAGAAWAAPSAGRLPVVPHEPWQTRMDSPQFRRACEEALAACRRAGDKRVLAEALDDVGNVLIGLGDREVAAALLQENLVLRRELGDRAGQARALGALGYAAWLEGDYERAGELWSECLVLRREIGDDWSVAYTLGHLGRIAQLSGQSAQAQALLEESLRFRRRLDDKLGTAATLFQLGDLHREEGDLETAGVFFREALPIWRDLGEAYGAVIALQALAGVTCAQGDAGRAARLLGAAQAMAGDAAVPHPDAEITAGPARAALGEEAFAAAWAEGRAMGREDAIAYALDAGAAGAAPL